MKTKNLITALICILSFSACEKNTIINEGDIIHNGPDIFTFTLEDEQYIDIEDGNGQWSVNNHQLAVLEIGALNDVDVVVAETQVMLRDEIPLCDADIDVFTGAALTMFPSDLPNNALIDWGSGGPGWTERWESDENFVFFDRTSVAVIDSTYENVYASFWVNLVEPTCDDQEKRVQAGTMVISVFRD